MTSAILARSYRRACGLSVVALTATCSGCYQYGPMSMTPEPGKQTVELLLNERGRADFVERLGPDAISLEGTLVERRDTTISVDVQSVSYVRQAATKWSGERLVITNGQIRDIRGKQLSVGKTAVAVGTAVAALIALIVTRSLRGGGDNQAPGSGGTPLGQ